MRRCGSIVQHRPYSARHEPVNDFLRVLGWNGHDADIYGPLSEERSQFIQVLNRQVADAPALELWVAVERSKDFESLGFESAVFDYRLSEPADAYDADVPLSVQSKNLTEPGEQRLNVVPAALLAESAEVAEVLSDLRGCHIEGLPECLGADDSLPVFGKRSQRPSVCREAIDHDFWNLKNHTLSDCENCNGWRTVACPGGQPPLDFVTWS